MTPRERRYLELTAMRAERIVKLARTALTHGAYVPSVMGLCGGLLVRTLFVLGGPELRHDFLRWLANTLDRNAGVCAACDNLIIVDDHGMCEVCWAQCAADDQEVDRFLLMERADTGETQ